MLPPTILKVDNITKYGGTVSKYGPGNHEGDPAYDRTLSFDGFWAGLGIGKLLVKIAQNQRIESKFQSFAGAFPFGTATGLGGNVFECH